MMMDLWRFSRFFSFIFAINLIAGCAINTPDNGIFEGENSNSKSNPSPLSYQGRLSLRIASDPAQSLYGAPSVAMRKLAN